jgi:hypothetical protein
VYRQSSLETTFGRQNKTWIIRAEFLYESITRSSLSYRKENMTHTEYENFTVEICEAYDMQVLSDYWGGTDERPDLGHPLYALGRRAELSAGLRGCQLTPYFDSMEKLESFCERNIDKFRSYLDADPDAPAPDTTNWV